MPTAVVASASVPFKTLDTPKSPSFNNPPADTKMFWVLISLQPTQQKLSMCRTHVRTQSRLPVLPVLVMRLAVAMRSHLCRILRSCTCFSPKQICTNQSSRVSSGNCCPLRFCIMLYRSPTYSSKRVRVLQANYAGVRALCAAGTLCMALLAAPSEHQSMTMQSLVPLVKHSLHLTMLGCFRASNNCEVMEGYQQ